MRRSIVINPLYQHLSSFIHSLPKIFSQQGKVIYKARNEIRVISYESTDFNVKRFSVPMWINRFVYTFLRIPKAKRAYEYAVILKEKEINTPAPVAYILENKSGLLSYSYFISLQVPYSHRFYEFGTSSLEGKEDIVKAFARFTAELHEKEVYHKDYSPGNILFDIVDGEPQFCIVDINRMEFGKVSIEKGCANFARLWGQKPFFELIAEEYAKARKADPLLCTELVLKYRKSFWKKYLKRHKQEFEVDL